MLAKAKALPPLRTGLGLLTVAAVLLGGFVASAAGPIKTRIKPRTTASPVPRVSPSPTAPQDLTKGEFEKEFLKRGPSLFCTASHGQLARCLAYSDKDCEKMVMPFLEGCLSEMSTEIPAKMPPKEAEALGLEVGECTRKKIMAFHSARLRPSPDCRSLRAGLRR